MRAEGLEVDVAARFPGFSLSIAHNFALNGCTAVFGPSGAGKSTLLRLIAGFSRPEAGSITFRGQTWFAGDQRRFIPARRRPVGVVFQQDRLFPHLTVEGNLHYADRRCRSADRRYEIAEIIKAFDLEKLLARRPRTLSGGERQRAAIARTLLTRPDLLLLDEPLSALDAGRKGEIIPYLDDLAGRFGAPTLYVSHNIDEIVRLADEVVILKSGRVEAAGPTAATLNAYAGPALSEGAAHACVFEGRVCAHDRRRLLTKVALGEELISVPLNDSKAVGAPARLRIDARNVAVATVAPSGLSIRNVLKTVVSDISGDEGSPFVTVAMQASGGVLRAQITRAAAEDLGLARGMKVFALVKSASFDL